MRFRKLRIAFSAACLIACVLLIVLWVISYWYFGSIEYRLSSTSNLMVNCLQGCTYMGTMLDTDAHWNVTIEPLSGSVLSTAKEVQSGNVTETIEVVVPIDWERNLREEMNWRGHFGFGLSHSPDMQFVSFPHWFLVLLSAAFAAAPWIPWPKSFSLRTLLIATTLFALLLGLVVYAIR